MRKSKQRLYVHLEWPPCADVAGDRPTSVAHALVYLKLADSITAERFILPPVAGTRFISVSVNNYSRVYCISILVHTVLLEGRTVVGACFKL